MTPSAPQPAGLKLRALQRDLAGARDAQLVQVVAMVNSMADRGRADALIAPLRGRLAQLRPKRPLTLVRLLFTPLDPLILPGPKWRRGQPGIPRTALTPLLSVVRLGIGEVAAAIEARIAGCTTDRADIIAAIGEKLWPTAASLLAAAEMPADWPDATGLPLPDFLTLSRASAALLAQAQPLQRLMADAAAGTDPSPSALERTLTAVAPAGPDALAMMAVLLMARLPRAEHLLLVIDDFAAKQNDAAGKALSDRAVDFVLDGIETAPPGGPQLAQAAADIGRVAAMLNDLASRAAQRPARRARIEQVRRQVDGNCREQFTAELDTQLLAPAAGLPDADDAAVATLESTARDLRRFETMARQIGGTEHYDRALRRAAEALRPMPGENQAARIDRIRLVEILQGPEAALALLAQSG